MIASRRDQIWAEAYKAYQNGEQWWLDDAQEALAQTQVAAREKTDLWDDILEQKLIDTGIYSTSLAAALQAIGVPNERMDDKAKDRASACLRRLGFESVPRKTRNEAGERQSVRIWVRKSDA